MPSQNDSQNQQGGTPPKSSIPPNIMPPEKDAQKAQSTKERPWWNRTLRFIFGFKTLEAIGIFAAVFYAWVNYQMKQAMKNSVDAMLAQNKISERNYYVANSPRIYINKARLRPPVVGQPVIIDVEFQNIGPLAAEKFGMEPHIEILKDEPKGLTASAGGKNLAEFNPTVKMSYAVNSAFKLDRAQYELITRGDEKIFFHGSFRYDNPLLPENVDTALSRPREEGAIDVKMFCFFYDPHVGPDPISCDHWLSEYRIIPQYPTEPQKAPK